MARPLGVEQGAVYELVAPSGARAVINDPSSPDFAGFLTSAPTGLERAGVRENAENLPEADGGIHGAFYRERMPFTLSGVVDTREDGANVGAQDRLLRATNALRADAMLRWVPSTIDEGVQVAFREQQPTRITGRRPKTFLVAGVAEDPFVYSQTLRSAIVDPAAPGTGGLVSPITSPLTSGASIVGQAFLLNDGSADAWPILTIRGPCVNASILNATLGLGLAFTFTLGAGQELYVETNPRRRAVSVGPTGGPYTPRYSALDFLNSRWWPLTSGINDVRVAFAGFSAGAQVLLQWRDAWG